MMNWWKSLKGKVRFNEPLKKHTTFKIGGPARFFVEPRDLKDLTMVLSLAKKHNLRLFLLGAGSNILACDKGINGIVIKLNSPCFKKIYCKGNILNAGSAVSLSRLVNYAAGKGLSGIEFLAGIPGTVGGALAMNAGAWKTSIGSIVKKVTVMDSGGRIKILPYEDIKFGYRKSSLTKYIILACSMKLAKKDKTEIRSRLQKYLNFRRNSQDSSYPNAGCIFKNPSSTKAAGRLIDLCTLKNKKIGGACVSKRHANFILNRNRANSRNILKLMSLVKARVKQKFDIILEPEIKIWK